MNKNDPEVRTAIGNWKGFTLPLETVFAAAEEWRQQLEGVEKPWLCWNVSENKNWGLLQQRLVREVGWTPVVGSDPRVAPPPLIDGAIAIDFNARFGFPIMSPHIPLEFAFVYAQRLAFWHSDMLCRLSTMNYLVDLFDALKDGETAAVEDKGGLRRIFAFNYHRYWEIVGCTTRKASQSQYDCGCGWMRHIECHPNAKNPEERRKIYYDHGVGIMYWKRKYGGKVIKIPRQRVEEGHCTGIGHPDYKRAKGAAIQDPTRELDMNYDLEAVARRLEIDHLL